MTDFGTPGAAPADAGGAPAQLGPVETLRADAGFMGRLFDERAAGHADARAAWDRAHQAAHPEPDEFAAQLDPRGYGLSAVAADQRDVAARSFATAGITHGEARQLVEAIEEAGRFGEMSEATVRQLEHDTAERLVRDYGAEDGRQLIDAARGLVRELERGWPGLRGWLNTNGRGSMYDTILAFANAAMARDLRR